MATETATPQPATNGSTTASSAPAPSTDIVPPFPFAAIVGQAELKPVSYTHLTLPTILRV